MPGDDWFLRLSTSFSLVSPAVDTVLFGVLEMVVHLSIKQKRFGRNAANVQACPAELRLFDQGDLQPKLPRANGAVYPAGPPPIIAMS